MQQLDLRLGDVEVTTTGGRDLDFSKSQNKAPTCDFVMLALAHLSHRALQCFINDVCDCDCTYQTWRPIPNQAWVTRTRWHHCLSAGKPAPKARATVKSSRKKQTRKRKLDPASLATSAQAGQRHLPRPLAEPGHPAHPAAAAPAAVVSLGTPSLVQSGVACIPGHAVVPQAALDPQMPLALPCARQAAADQPVATGPLLAQGASRVEPQLAAAENALADAGLATAAQLAASTAQQPPPAAHLRGTHDLQCHPVLPQLTGGPSQTCSAEATQPPLSDSLPPEPPQVAQPQVVPQTSWPASSVFPGSESSSAGGGAGALPAVDVGLPFTADTAGSVSGRSAAQVDLQLTTGLGGLSQDLPAPLLPSLPGGLPSSDAVPRAAVPFVAAVAAVSFGAGVKQALQEEAKPAGLTHCACAAATPEVGGDKLHASNSFSDSLWTYPADPSTAVGGITAVVRAGPAQGLYNEKPTAGVGTTAGPSPDSCVLEMAGKATLDKEAAASHADKHMAICKWPHVHGTGRDLLLNPEKGKNSKGEGRHATVNHGNHPASTM